LLLLSPLLLCALIAIGVDLLDWRFRRHIWNVILTLPLFGLATVAFWADRREPSAGHRYVGLAFLLVSGSAISLALAGSPSAYLRYWGFVPMLVIGLTLLTVSLRRRRQLLMNEVTRRAAAERSLVDINVSLEAQVEARTRELRDVIDGLEGFNRQVSHDLRGPLGGIGGLAQLSLEALQRGDAAAAQRLLSPIPQRVELASRLVEALLTLARSGGATLNRLPLDVERLAREVADGLQHSVAASERVPVVEIGALPRVEAMRRCCARC
jgi:signal transduction histidine kinase